jgi:STE24 endopeptidase
VGCLVRIARRATLPTKGKTARAGLKARFGYALRRLRDELAVLLIPIAIILIAADAGTLAARWARNENARWIAYAVGFAALIVVFPNMLRSLWRTFEMPEGSLKSRVSVGAIKLGIQYRGIHVWDSGGRMANAAVIGILPRWRYILLTDELIARLTSREVEAVALHEMAHIARRHTLWRTLALFPPLGMWLLVQEFWPSATAFARQQYTLGDLALAGSVPLTVGFVVYAIAVLAFVSRLFEHDADLLAIGELQRGASNGSDESADGDFASALRKLVSSDRRRARRKSWLHPSINRRLAFLRVVSLREEKSTRFRRRLRAICALLAFCPLATAATLICRKLS